MRNIKGSGATRREAEMRDLEERTVCILVLKRVYHVGINGTSAH